MTTRNKVRSVLATTFLLALLPAGRVIGQQTDGVQDSSLTSWSFGRYEALKKDKGSALAWSMVVPAGAVFYAGSHPEFAAGIGMIEAASLGGVIYLLHQQDRGTAVSGDHGMTVTFILLYAACKILEVTHAFALIDGYNLELWERVFRRQEEPKLGYLPFSRLAAVRPGVGATLLFTF